MTSKIWTLLMDARVAFTVSTEGIPVGAKIGLEEMGCC